MTLNSQIKSTCDFRRVLFNPLFKQSTSHEHGAQGLLFHKACGRNMTPIGTESAGISGEAGPHADTQVPEYHGEEGRYSCLFMDKRQNPGPSKPHILICLAASIPTQPCATEKEGAKTRALIEQSQSLASSRNHYKPHTSLEPIHHANIIQIFYCVSPATFRMAKATWSMLWVFSPAMLIRPFLVM